MYESIDEIESSLRWALSKPMDYLFLLGRGSDLASGRAGENKNGKLIRFQGYWCFYKARLTETQRQCVIWCITKRDVIPCWSVEIARRHTGVNDPISVADGAIIELSTIIHRAVYPSEACQEDRSTSRAL